FEHEHLLQRVSASSTLEPIERGHYSLPVSPCRHVFYFRNEKSGSCASVARFGGVPVFPLPNPKWQSPPHMVRQWFHALVVATCLLANSYFPTSRWFGVRRGSAYSLLQGSSELRPCESGWGRGTKPIYQFGP